jgi:hypothetical protein
VVGTLEEGIRDLGDSLGGIRDLGEGIPAGILRPVGGVEDTAEASCSQELRD